MRLWTQFLEPFSVAAVRYAFDNWNRNGRFFPKPKDIIEQVEAYKLSREPKGLPPGCPNCEEGWVRIFAGRTENGNTIDPELGAVQRCECFADRTLRRQQYTHFGEGYNGQDIAYLWKLYEAKSKAVNGRPLNKIEVDCLLDVLDKQRGSTPEWRRSA